MGVKIPFSLGIIGKLNDGGLKKGSLETTYYVSMNQPREIFGCLYPKSYITTKLFCGPCWELNAVDIFYCKCDINVSLLIMGVEGEVS